MVNQVRARLYPPLQLRLWHPRRLPQQAPEQRIHASRQSRNVEALPGTWQLRKPLEYRRHTPRRPSMNLLLLPEFMDAFRTGDGLSRQ